MKVRFGIIGPGNIAKKMAQAINLCEDTQLYAVASRNIKKAEVFGQKFGAEKAYGSYEEILSDPNVDAVYIALPNSLHVELAVRAMEKGKAVLSEKPFAPRLEMTQKAVDYAREHQVLLVEGMWTRWLPCIQSAKKWIESGLIGKASLMRASFCFNLKNKEDHRYSKQLGGGALMDVGCYCIDNMIYLAGEVPAKVSGVMQYGETGVDINGAVALKFGSGLIGHAGFSLCVSTDADAWIYGDNGRILLKDFWCCKKAICYDLDGNVLETMEDSEGNGFVYELREFCELFRNGKKESRFMSLTDTLVCSHVMEQLIQDAAR